MEHDYPSPIGAYNGVNTTPVMLLSIGGLVNTTHLAIAISALFIRIP